MTVAVGGVPDYDPARAWTLVAGGDILLDRGVSLALGAARRGADYMFERRAELNGELAMGDEDESDHQSSPSARSSSCRPPAANTRDIS